VKIARCSDGRAAFWAVIEPDAGVARPLAGGFADWAPALTADLGTPPPFTGGERALEELRLVAPAEASARVLAAGATYAKHIAGLGLQMPEQPAAFLKGYSTIIGPEDEIVYPAVTEALDFEVELVAVMGDAPARAPGFRSILGYTIGNDVSARDLQFSHTLINMDMFSAKALDQTAPLGPWIVTRDEFGDGQPDLELTLLVDGEVRQRERTASMAWSVGEIVTYIDARMRLTCGDIIFTGTPAGVGHETGRYLEPGHVVEATIERIGTLRNRVSERTPPRY
jgi:2-keto-4-pentenoate hydratase/2-oxohepta-3-ene-1,7-dioic acid hydratase in catechol pathway